MKITAFDFDGTLTKRDSLWIVLLNSADKKTICLNILKELPSLLSATIGFKSKSVAKEQLFKRFFAGWKTADFRGYCGELAIKHKNVYRKKILKKFREALMTDDCVYVVTASAEVWVEAFILEIPDIPQSQRDRITIVGTQLEDIEGKLTGHFASKNCKGYEKVLRLKALLPERNQYFLTAYGNSKDDMEMLDYADEGHLV